MAIPELEEVEPFAVMLKVIIRLCRREDLPACEWFGLFAADRHFIQSTFESQERGDALMLVAEVNGAPAGQLWIDLTRKDVDATGIFWAVRVFPYLQNLGIGTRLFDVGERILCNRGFRRVELAVEKNNPAARRFYERLGFRDATEEANPSQAMHRWLMRKILVSPIKAAEVQGAPERGRDE